ncbi:MAG TPA: serine hydrolase domain-containing protein [Acidimicrobiales bacterium]
MDALDEVARWPVGMAAVAVVLLGPDGLGPTTTVGDADSVLPWASVTKTATALAVLVAAEEGTLDLDEPAGPPGSTVRHLLAHASGLGPEAGPPVEPPGTRRIYSNTGYEALARLVEAAAGMPFAEYLAAGVLEPLGMTASVLTGADPEFAAAGMVGPLSDMVRLGREWARPSLVSEVTWREATAVQFPGLGGVLPGFGPFDPCDWGLGVEVRGAKRPHWTGRSNSPATYGHFGQSGSFLWVDPVAGVLCCGLADRPFGVWASRAWPALADAVLDELSAHRPTARPAPRAASGPV